MTDVFRAELKQAGLDPRRTLARPGVADAALKGRIAAEDFVTPEEVMLGRAKSPLLRHGAPDAPRETELLHGEPLKKLCEEGGFAFVQSQVDGYAGYVETAALAPLVEPSHKVAVPATFLYPLPDIKTGPLNVLFLGSLVKAEPSDDERFLRLPGQGFVFARHLAPYAAVVANFAATAEGFLHAPYLWGGRSAHGLDCSALVQLSLMAAGRECPRDTDMQWGELGEVIAEGAPDMPLKRGDLVFWEGHVGIMQSPERIIHANGYHMQVRSEPLEEAIGRIAALYGPVKGVKRI